MICDVCKKPIQETYMTMHGLKPLYHTINVDHKFCGAKCSLDWYEKNKTNAKDEGEV